MKSVPIGRSWAFVLFAAAAIVVFAAVALLSGAIDLPWQSWAFLCVVAGPPLFVMAVFLIAHLEAGAGASTFPGSELEILLLRKRRGELVRASKLRRDTATPAGDGARTPLSAQGVPDGEVLNRLVEWKRGLRATG